jgi:hypothetical protein
VDFAHSPCRRIGNRKINRQASCQNLSIFGSWGKDAFWKALYRNGFQKKDSILHIMRSNSAYQAALSTSQGSYGILPNILQFPSLEFLAFA